MGVSMRLILSSLIFLIGAVGPVKATCTTPIFPPMAFERPAWAALELLKPPPPALDGIIGRQDLDDDGHGDINLDFYSITLDANGQSAAALLAELRRNLNEVIFADAGYSVEPADARQARLWAADAPLGAVMVFTLAEIPGVMALERGAVFVACASPTDFVFSTVEMAGPGLHPVAGNRAFGVHDHGNGSLSIYVMAADRVVARGAFGSLPGPLRERIFIEGDKVWRRMLDNIAYRYAPRTPRNPFVFSQRVAF